MGLDMYLDKYPKLGMKLSTIDAIESWWDYNSNPRARNSTFKEWCGHSEDELPIKEVMNFCETLKHDTYFAWDYDKKYPNQYMHDPVGYWRKANAIHYWIERNVVIAEEADESLEDCKPYLVKKEHVEKLLEDCEYVLANSKLVSGKIKNGEQHKDGKWIPIYEDGILIEDPTIAQETLPTRSGFFFGCTDYNQYYIDDLKHTVDICEKVLRDTDFSRYELYYSASW